MLMYSTFLGLLTGVGLQFGHGKKARCDNGIELLNANPRIADLLENLGVIHLFKLSSGPLQTPEPVEARTHTPLNPSKEEVTRACLEAHRTLMEANPENVGRFKEVTQFLAEDLKHLKAKPR